MIIKYKNYNGTSNLDKQRHVYRGKILDIADLITYEAATKSTIQQEFELAVDDYLETCRQLDKIPQLKEI